MANWAMVSSISRRRSRKSSSTTSSALAASAVSSSGQPVYVYPPELALAGGPAPFSHRAPSVRQSLVRLLSSASRRQSQLHAELAAAAAQKRPSFKLPASPHHGQSQQLPASCALVTPRRVTALSATSPGSICLPNQAPASPQWPSYRPRDSGAPAIKEESEDDEEAELTCSDEANSNAREGRRESVYYLHGLRVKSVTVRRHSRSGSDDTIKAEVDRTNKKSSSLIKRSFTASNQLAMAMISMVYMKKFSFAREAGMKKKLDEHHDCGREGCEIVRINVSGMPYDIRLSALNNRPDTLLGNPARRLLYWDPQRQEFFFDRFRPTFEAIFEYYQYGGKLKRPKNVPEDIFLDEVKFFEIEKASVDEYLREEGYVEDEYEFPEGELAKKIWIIFEYPETSRTAFVVGIVSVVITIISIVSFCLETLPLFAVLAHTCIDDMPNFLEPFFVIETICTAWFTFEFIVRLAVSPNKCSFLKNVKNLVDCVAVVPYYITLLNILWKMDCESAKGSASLGFLRVVRLIRVFKLTKHSPGLQVLLLTFKASFGGLGLFLVALFVCMLLFSSTIYYAEVGQPNATIDSIPDAFWWSIITMCTVGYGDEYPVSVLGKLVGSVCAIAGVLTLAIPVPIITENFNKFYAHKSKAKPPAS